MASTTAKYPTAPLACWNKAKELRKAYYKEYATAHERGALRWAGGAWSLGAVPVRTGRDVHSLTSEPYGRQHRLRSRFSRECLEPSRRQGYARDLCSYMRNYWGSLLLDRYAFGGPFPKPDFIWQDHICCSHAKWYQVVTDLEPEVPHFCVDVSVGPYNELNANRLGYVVGQLHDGIEWLEKTTGRTYDDGAVDRGGRERVPLHRAVGRGLRAQQGRPGAAGREEHVLALRAGNPDEARPEGGRLLRGAARRGASDRVDRGIAAVANERCRVMSDTQPPWAFLDVFRYLEEFGCVSVGSLYTFALIGMWEVKEDGSWGPRTTPMEQGVEIKDRDQALRILADWNLSKPEWQHFYSPHLKSEMMIRIAREWKLDGVMLHYNRGCEGLTIGIAENRLALIEAGYPVMTFEGNMGDEREFDRGEDGDTHRRLHGDAGATQARELSGAQYRIDERSCRS